MIRAALLTLLARASAAHNRALLAAAASCPGDGEGLVVGNDELYAVGGIVRGPLDVSQWDACLYQSPPIYDQLRAEWRRNANDYARAMADLDAADTVQDLIYVGGWDE